jgi:hypothetical protein
MSKPITTSPFRCRSATRLERLHPPHRIAQPSGAPRRQTAERLLPMRAKHRRHARPSRRIALVSASTSRRCYARACSRTPSARPHDSKIDSKVVVASATLLIPYLSRTTTKSRGNDENRPGTESPGQRRFPTVAAGHRTGPAQPLKVETRVRTRLGLPAETLTSVGQIGQRSGTARTSAPLESFRERLGADVEGSSDRRLAWVAETLEPTCNRVRSRPRRRSASRARSPPR